PVSVVAPPPRLYPFFWLILNFLWQYLAILPDDRRKAGKQFGHRHERAVARDAKGGSWRPLTPPAESPRAPGKGRGHGHRGAACEAVQIGDERPRPGAPSETTKTPCVEGVPMCCMR